MAFFLGWLCGVVVAVAARCLWVEWVSDCGVEKPMERHTSSQHKHWTQTHNFLYYDGTVMPEIKEDEHE